MSDTRRSKDRPRWVIWKHEGVWDDRIKGPDTGDDFGAGTVVAPAAEVERLREALKEIALPEHDRGRSAHRVAREALDE